MKIKKIRYCVSCGKEVSGRIKKCQECKDLEKLHKCMSCDEMIEGKQRKCPKCIAKEREARRWKTCSCGITFRLEDHQGGGEKICKKCKDGDYKFVFRRITDFLNCPDEYWNDLSFEKKVRKFASKSRNDIQAITDYPEFKLNHIRFASVPKNSPTWDHINAMTYFIERYIWDCIEDPSKQNFDYFREYLLHYACQFRVTQKHNMDLAKIQRAGVTPDKYINVVGPIEGKTIEESIEIIKPYFIHG
jgi:hypothetical protein